MSSSVNSGPVWLITGASRGLGRSLVDAALESGARVAAGARNPGEGSLDASDNLLPVRVDVTDTASVDAAARATLDRFGRLDVVVNNAGRGLLGAVEETGIAQSQALFDLNVHGPQRVLRAVLPTLRAQGTGRIVNISSLGGFLASAGNGVYGATKAALEGMSEALSAELAGTGIRVTVVEPGFFRTEFLSDRSVDRADDRIPDYDGVLNRNVTALDGKQPGDPLKAARAIVEAVHGDDPPFRLALGPDAVQRVRTKLTSASAELEAWLPVSLSTDLDEPEK
ncbi:MAG: SDR family NAD(P)-dependent oxidoreductase [Leucobacter sp.]